MAGITRRAICNPLLLPRVSIYAGVDEAVHALAGQRYCCESHHSQRRQRHHPHRHQHQQQRSIASLNGFYALDGFNAASPSSRLFTGLKGRRFSHSETTADEPHQPSEKQRLKPSSDPTAKRPTQKCDPYGLQGESLPRDQCLGLLATLEDGWALLPSENDAVETTADNNGSMDDAAPTILHGGAPTFLQMQCHHTTMSDASQFLSRISMIATNINHYPHLSVERILVDDVTNVLGENNNNQHTTIDNNDNEIGSRKKKKRKVKGWVFQSTIRCSTYRPPTRRNDDRGGMHADKGLTFHDFHLAMNVDVEMSREEIRRLLRSDPED